MEIRPSLKKQKKTADYADRYTARFPSCLRHPLRRESCEYCSEIASTTAQAAAAATAAEVSATITIPETTTEEAEGHGATFAQERSPILLLARNDTLLAQRTK